MLVEPPSLVIHRVYHHRSDPNDVSRFFNALQCIEQKSLSKSLSFFRDVHREASEQDDTYRVFREAFCNSFRALVRVDRTRGKRVISDDAILTDGYVGFRRVWVGLPQSNVERSSSRRSFPMMNSGSELTNGVQPREIP